jgi:putative transposase
MSHSFVNALFHCVFSTKQRRPLITPALQERLWPMMGGIAREQGLKALTIGGVEDHVHLLLSIPATIPLAKAIQMITLPSDESLGYCQATLRVENTVPQPPLTEGS